MCSPSLSQSVQINRALLYLAWFRMFSAMGSLSYNGHLVIQVTPEHVGLPYLINILLDRSFEQSARGTRHPALVLTVKIQSREMADHASHGDGAVPPGTTKIEVKLIIFHILIATY